MGNSVTFLAQVFGKNTSHIDFDSFETPVMKMCVEDFRTLKLASVEAGFDLRFASGFRSFDRQLRLWNEKMSGRRPLLDKDEAVIDASDLSEYDKIVAILQWSALPGTSRHHWGTDVDVYDASNMKATTLQLTIHECETVFKFFYQWLDAYLLEEACPFFRPYYGGSHGINCEPWHLSHKSASETFSQGINKKSLIALLQENNIMGKATLLAHVDEIFERFVVL